MRLGKIPDSPWPRNKDDLDRDRKIRDRLKAEFAAIKRRDADDVEKLVRAHIMRGQEAVLKEFDRQSNNSEP